MKATWKRRSFLTLHTLGVVSMLGLLSVAWAATAPAARAEIGACRSDPVILLSNGVTLDVSADIGDSVADVGQVSYTVHLPATVTVTGIVQTDGILGLKEVLTFDNTSASGSYKVSTKVLTGLGGVTVTATTSAIRGLISQSISVNGQDQQSLQQQVQLPDNI